jgi:outer membrane protein TolC
MKQISLKSIIKQGIYLLVSGASIHSLYAQATDSTQILKLSLNGAIRYAKESNKLIGVLRTEEKAALLDEEDAKMNALPRIHSSASYQRYSKITLFEGVLGDSHSIPKPPNANSGTLGLEAAFNLYSGGRHRSVTADLEHKSELASLNTQEQESNIGLQVAIQYLEMVRYYFQERVIKDQVTRALTRSKNVSAFYRNGKVTKSDVLRAEVLLSNAMLSETANKNDYLISNQKLNTLLNLDGFTRIIPVDTTSLNLTESLELEDLLKDFSGSYAILKARKNIELQENRTKLSRSLNFPTVAVYGGYGLNYPNTFVFPPVAQSLAVGLVGLKLTYDISSIYQNKNKVRASQLRENELKTQQDWIADNIQQEARALSIKYKEAVNRLAVIKKSVAQAEANYNIQNTKYANQLSLLTDLLDADNLYQESSFNYIQANIAALSIYYRLLFITGKL